MDAAAAMASKIMTPVQLIQKIQEGMNDDTVKDQQTKELEESMAEMENKITEVKQELNYLYGDKIKKFNDEISKITNTINQGPDWYIDQVNRIEMKYEKEATKAIQDVTANILDKKFMFRDAMVDAVSYNLVIPVNKELEKVQLEIVRKVVELAKLAIITAKALAQKAILKLLALFGA
jgi:Rps23 Pro-64 3,4-dihydroxylase Tpa1-like proline 4-hydroxylase